MPEACKYLHLLANVMAIGGSVTLPVKQCVLKQLAATSKSWEASFDASLQIRGSICISSNHLWDATLGCASNEEASDKYLASCTAMEVQEILGSLGPTSKLRRARERVSGVNLRDILFVRLVRI